MDGVKEEEMECAMPEAMAFHGFLLGIQLSFFPCDGISVSTMTKRL